MSNMTFLSLLVVGVVVETQLVLVRLLAEAMAVAVLEVIVLLLAHQEEALLLKAN